MTITDPVEKIVAEALDLLGVKYTHESGNKEQRLDFYLPEFEIYIECKAFSTTRTAKQVENKNVIVIQGRSSALAFKTMLSLRGNI